MLTTGALQMYGQPLICDLEGDQGSDQFTAIEFTEGQFAVFRDD